MSDFDQTVYSEGGAQGAPGAAPQSSYQAPAAKRPPLLIIGGIGCLLLICAALLIGGGLTFREQLTDLVAGGGEGETPIVETPTVIEPTATPMPTEEAAPEPTSEQTVESEAAPPVSSEPVIGVITFALGATEENEPIDPGTSFEEGVTEIHAIFEYSGMLSDYTWERIWYLDGEEMLKNSAAWADRESGRFDYFVDAGGDPLAPGEWTLELYVEGELLAKGDFTIEAEEKPEVAKAEDTPTPTPTPKPAATKPSSASAPSGGGVYQLVYTKWDGGQHNVYVADTNGSNEQFLLGRAAGPSWTPDGKYIFFFGEEGIDRQVREGVEYVFDGISNGVVSMEASPMPANIGEVQLFQGLDWKQGSARWANVSPNGQMVAFDAKPGGNYRIYFLGTADNQQFRFEIVGEQADWSPDSDKVVYRSGRDGITGIWISNRDDSGHTNITTVGSDSFPAWSPDGKTIAFSRDVDGNVDIYTMDVDGSNVQRLTDAPGPDTLPVYTPSGDIIFRSARTGAWGIWKMSSAGANQTEIIPNAGVGDDWSFSRMDVR
jgi:Tol biopolymer transport system component